MSNIAIKDRKLLFLDDLSGEFREILNFGDRMRNLSGVTLIPEDSGGDSLVEKFTAFFQHSVPQNGRTFTKLALTFLLSGLVAGRLLARNQVCPVLSIGAPDAFYYDILQGVLKLFRPYAPYYLTTLGASAPDDTGDALARTVLGTAEDGPDERAAALAAYTASLCDNGFSVGVLDGASLGEKAETVVRDIVCRLRPGGLLLVCCGTELAEAPFWEALFPERLCYGVDADTQLIQAVITGEIRENAHQGGADAAVCIAAFSAVERYTVLKNALDALWDKFGENGCEAAAAAAAELERALFGCYDNLENLELVDEAGDLKEALLEERFSPRGNGPAGECFVRERWERFSGLFQREFEIFGVQK